MFLLFSIRTRAFRGKRRCRYIIIQSFFCFLSVTAETEATLVLVGRELVCWNRCIVLVMSTDRAVHLSLHFSVVGLCAENEGCMYRRVMQIV